ncbi:MAG: pyridoxal phosphate-dependent aminotransferase [Chitinophagales bacterium]|nr:pyridoxal phosphate-dependent aminotransferase [Chitinophagales bacterium]MDW8392752.1 pyridoxal phosphate-dependent aminotransferase [Chitinophagales bacterium]
MQFLSQRIQQLAESETLQTARLSRELRAQGVDVIDLSLGEPDFPTPAHICHAAKNAIDQGFTRYPPVAGYPELRQAISEKFRNENALEFAPEQVVVSTGAKQALANVMLVLVNPGEEVILPAPYWVSYREMVKLAQGTMVTIPTEVHNNFKITPEQLEAAITPRTKVFCFSSPCNPTGSVYTADELAALADVFERHPHVIIVSDEIYEHISFTGAHHSIAQCKALHGRVVVVNGVSKAYAMTGWRLGYIGAPLWLARACDKMQGQITSGANAIAQRAALAALTGDQTETHRMREAFRRRRDLIIDLLQQMPGVIPNRPEGAFYIFPDISHYIGTYYKNWHITSADVLADYLIREAHVAVVTGKAFGNDHCIRISYAASEEKIRLGMQRMQEALTRLQHKSVGGESG